MKSFTKNTYIIVITILCIALTLRAAICLFSHDHKVLALESPVEVNYLDSPIWGPRAGLHQYMAAITLESKIDEEVLEAYIVDALSNYNLHKEDN